MRIIFFLAASVFSYSAAMAQEPVTTSDLAHDRHFASAYHAMARLPAWVTSGNATSIPVQNITISDVSYVLGHLCKPHDCADQQFDVVFSADGKKAWGLFTRLDGKTIHQIALGEPNSAIMATLNKSYRDNNPTD